MDSYDANVQYPHGEQYTKDAPSMTAVDENGNEIHASRVEQQHFRSGFDNKIAELAAFAARKQQLEAEMEAMKQAQTVDQSQLVGAESTRVDHLDSSRLDSYNHAYDRDASSVYHSQQGSPRSQHDGSLCSIDDSPMPDEYAHANRGLEVVYEDGRQYNKDSEIRLSAEDMTPEQLAAVLQVAGIAMGEKLEIRVDAAPTASMLNTIVPVSNKKPRFERRWHNRIAFGIALLGMAYVTEEWVRGVVIKTMADSYYPRYGLLIFLPAVLFFLIFGLNTILICAFSLFGPVSHIAHNSPYYSVYPPDIETEKPEHLPLVTVQIPIYKESFTETIRPTLESVEKSMIEYSKAGGMSNIFLNDDGLMIISEEERAERIAYYNEKGIAYCARPGHDVVPRRGRFKKASNMNFCLTVAHRLDEIVEKIRAGEPVEYQFDPSWDEIQLRSNIVQQMGAAEGFMAGNFVKMGSYVLLLDSDSRVPVDCMLPVIIEMEQSPNIAFTQHLTRPMQIVHDYWENAISHFTTRVYENAIVMSCSGGDVAPLMGHNAFLRWEALQKASFVAEYDGKRKYWSEDHVSEDFDLAIRVYHAGYGARYGAYGEGFEEGVSLCVRDEITRFQKYAFGASEVLFNPISQWCRKGIFGDVISRFQTAKHLPTTSKYNITGYLGTYFAMACAPILVVANYFLYAYSSVWRNDTMSGEIWLVIFMIFAVFSPIANVVFAYRTARGDLVTAFIKEMGYTIILTIFFNGLPYHIMTACLAHVTGYNMQWGSTAKEITLTNFGPEFKTTIKQYWQMYVIDFLMIAMMCVMAFVVPDDWKINTFPAIFPMALMLSSHAAMPIVLNPVLMRIKF